MAYEREEESEREREANIGRGKREGLRKREADSQNWELTLFFKQYN